MITCKICKKIIKKNPHESWSQHNSRITCSVICQHELRKGIPLSPAHKKKISISKKGNTFISEKTKKLISEKTKGRPQSKEHTENATEKRWGNKRLLPHQKNAEYRYFYNMKKKHNISREEYKKMFDNQNGVCFICNTQSKERLCVDHSHTTNKVRGLLCRVCNSVLGLMNDDVIRFERAILYLNSQI